MELGISLHEPGTGQTPVITVVTDGIAVRGLEDQTSQELAFSRFYADHHQPVARALGLSLGDADLGSEAADEAMTRACQKWDVVSGYHNPQGWVYRVGLNWARSLLRRRRRLRPSMYLHELPVFDPAPTDPALTAALARLDDKHRSVVVLRYYLDWSVEATAEALSIKPGTVKSRLSRALKQMQRHMAVSGAPSKRNSR